MATPFLITVTLWITGCLTLLNIACAVYFRGRRLVEVLSYAAAGLVELAIFAFALLLHLEMLRSIPYHLPPGLPFNRSEIGAALALGIGLFPVAYWHRSSSRHIRDLMAKEAQEAHSHKSGVRVRSSTPGEWMN